MKNSDTLLLIFYRNPEWGKVKTRLAATVGNERALDYYIRLAAHTRAVALPLACDKALFYSHAIDENDAWPNTVFQKQVQTGDDLGAKMHQAFAWGFSQGYRFICIIGTDCFELTTGLLSQAFTRLATGDAVLGPAADGGYYLLGMNALHSAVFQGKQWSTASVAADTRQDFERLALRWHELPVLTDVDEEKDLPAGW